MRVLSQWNDIDIDYQSSTFMIDKNEEDSSYTIIAINNGLQYCMANYSDMDKAREAISQMSYSYKRYLITDKSNTMTLTDAMDCELDTPFEKIEIREIEATLYKFPEDEEI